VAGLQLAALSARPHAGAAGGSEDVARFVEAFSGSHRFVLDYLVEEVLDHQPEEVRAFLLDTSILDQLTGGLCDAVTGRSDGQSMLEALERENLFVVPLDDARRWYRYHHLFADALRARLLGGQAHRVGGLHASASRWLVQNGLLTDAVGHAIASGDHEYAAELVELALPDLRRRRQDRTFEAGWSPCPRLSSVADRCWPPSWRGAGSGKATSTEWSRGSTPRRMLWTCRRRPSPRRMRWPRRPGNAKPRLAPSPP
jgi:hypothetical protein